MHIAHKAHNNPNRKSFLLLTWLSLCNIHMPILCGSYLSHSYFYYNQSLSCMVWFNCNLRRIKILINVRIIKNAKCSHCLLCVWIVYSVYTFHISIKCMLKRTTVIHDAFDAAPQCHHCYYFALIKLRMITRTNTKTPSLVLWQRLEHERLIH